MQEVLSISTSKKQEMIDLKSQVSDIVSNSGIRNGICTVFVKHTSAAIIINENADPNIPVDIFNALSGLIKEGIWKHDAMDGNAASHIKATILGPSETIPIQNSKLLLGAWQSPLFVELDGPRKREIVIQIVGE